MKPSQNAMSKESFAEEIVAEPQTGRIQPEEDWDQELM